MKSRGEIKKLARAAIAEQRGVAISTIVLFYMIVFIGGIFSYIHPALGILVLLTIFFVDNPLGVNVCGVFIKIFNHEETRASEILDNFPVNYLRKVGGIAWMWLFTFLWSLLFIIPGIIKGISYSMTWFILADCPNVGATDALKLSMRMTSGHKWKLFVLGLSFIGWMILWGILSLVIIVPLIFFGLPTTVITIAASSIYAIHILPYMYATYAGFYVELRNEALANGVIDHSELDYDF